MIPWLSCVCQSFSKISLLFVLVLWFLVKRDWLPNTYEFLMHAQHETSSRLAESTFLFPTYLVRSKETMPAGYWRSCHFECWKSEVHPKRPEVWFFGNRSLQQKLICVNAMSHSANQSFWTQRLLIWWDHSRPETRNQKAESSTIRENYNNLSTG